MQCSGMIKVKYISGMQLVLGGVHLFPVCGRASRHALAPFTPAQRSHHLVPLTPNPCATITSPCAVPSCTHL